MAQTKSSSPKLAVVTGASRGLGLAIALELSSRGYHPILTGRDEQALQRAVARVPNSVGITCEIRDPESVAAFVKHVRRMGKLDVLVNNAGIAGPSAPIAETNFEQWRAVIDTNLHGTFLVTQALLPLLKKGCTVVNNLSVAARTVFPGMAAYGASKSALASFTATLREELRPRGVRVVALLPGAVDTEIWQQFWPQVPRRRMIAPATIARLVAEAVTAPPAASVDEIVITPSSGAL